jgi:two-component SAPR family response regulator
MDQVVAIDTSLPVADGVWCISAGRFRIFKKLNQVRINGRVAQFSSTESTLFRLLLLHRHEGLLFERIHDVLWLGLGREKSKRACQSSLYRFRGDLSRYLRATIDFRSNAYFIEFANTGELEVAQTISTKVYPGEPWVVGPIQFEWLTTGVTFDGRECPGGIEQKPLTLLAALLEGRDGVSIPILKKMVWPASNPNTIRGTLSTSIYRLRTALKQWVDEDAGIEAISKSQDGEGAYKLILPDGF